MKAKVFIGSSVESLDVAHAVQENLEHDCNPTVWTQGIFQLSSNTLDDLIKIRGKTHESVRDNVIFELGLFIGKLGKVNVFFVVPKNETNLHLPSDLAGITPGTFDNKREDGNLKAALGPFCNQIRNKLKNYILNHLNDLENETIEAKKIVLEKPICWEFLLAAELMESKFKKINESYLELETGLIFQKITSLTEDNFPKWIADALKDLQALIRIFTNVLTEELHKAFGEPGIAGDILEIKSACNRLLTISKELLAWEYRLHGINFPEGLEEIKVIMSGWTQPIFREINKLPNELKRMVMDYKEGKPSEEYMIKLNLDAPKGVERIGQILDNYRENLCI